MDYIKAIIERDVRHIAKVDHLRQMPRLTGVLAQHSAQLVNYSSLGAALSMNHVTTQKYVEIHERLYLIRTLQPWYNSELMRLIKTPKLHFTRLGFAGRIAEHFSGAAAVQSRVARSAAGNVRAG